MASFEQDAESKLWSVRFRTIERGVVKNKRLRGFRTKKEAQTAYVKYEKIAAIPNDAIFSELVEKYIADLTPVTKQSTMYSRKRIFKTFILPVFGSMRMSEITKQSLYEWQSDIWNITKDGKRYKHKYLVLIKGSLVWFLRWVYKIYDIKTPFDSFITPKSVDQKEERPFWELEQFNAFIRSAGFNLQKANSRLYYTFYHFLMFTGMRLGEVLAFEESSYDGEHVTVKQTHSRKTTNGNPYVITATKNYKQYTKLIPEQLKTVLDEYIAFKRKNNLSDKYLFGGDRPMSEHTIQYSLNEYIRKANETLAENGEPLLPRITHHGFRHSYVSLLVRVGCNTKTVAALIGDTEEQITKTYAHLYKDETTNAIKRLSTAITLSN